MDPASAMLLFVLFQATEKVISYAGGKVADSVTKPFWEALEEKTKWLSGNDDTIKRWEAFSKAFTEASGKLESAGRHPELARNVSDALAKFTVVDPSDSEWLTELGIQLEKASLVSEKPDEFLLVELFSRLFSKQGIQFSRAELSETVSDFVSIFQDKLFAQPVYREEMFRRAQWQALRQPHYDTRERYIAQIINYHENLDFVGIPELKDRQALRIEDVFISLQTATEDDVIFNEGELIQMFSGSDFSINDISKKFDDRVNSVAEELGRNIAQKTRKLTVNQALSENQKFVVLGDPGSGKTTLLKYIVLAYAENQTTKLGLNETRLPIFIRLYDYAAKREECGKDGLSFTDYLNKYCTDHLQLHLPPDFFEQALEQGVCCVCFDGLDELGAAGLRREITLAVSAMANRYARNRFIVTSRIVGYEEAPLDKNDFTHHTVQPLSDEDIKLFVEKWYKAREKDAVIRRERTEHLIKTIMGEERIKSLASNPLMLTIIALVHRIEAELPHERVKLYDKCVTTLVETWDKVRGMKTASRRRLLEKLAYWIHSEPGEKGHTREVREGTLQVKIAFFLQSDPKNNLNEDQIREEVENFINLVKTRSGLLVERGENVYTFSHLTFQEYLAARDIERRLPDTDSLWHEIQPKLYDAHWREVILLLLGSLNGHDYHNSILVRRILEDSDIYESVLHRHLFLAAQTLSDHVEVDSALHDQIVDNLLKLAVSGEFAQYNALDSLGSLKNDLRAGDGLFAIADDKKEYADVRRVASQALARLGRVDEAGKILLSIAGDQELNTSVRLVTMQALGELGHADQAVLQGLRAMAEDLKASDTMRFGAARTLGQLACMDEAGKILLAMAQDETVDDSVCLAAVQALGQLGHADEVILNVVLAIAEDEKVDDSMRRVAAQALAQLGRVDEAGKILLAMAGDQKVDDSMRRVAAQALVQLGRVDEAGKILLAMAGDQKVYASVRRAAAHALGELGHADKAGKILLVIAEDKGMDDSVRRDAVQSLGQLGYLDDAVLNGLLSIAEDEKQFAGMRRAAAQSLGQLGYVDEAGKILLAIAGDHNVADFVRLAAAQGLGQLGRVHEAGKILLAMAEDQKVDASLRRVTADALGQLGYSDETVLNGLLTMAGDKKASDSMRYGVAQALGQLGHANEAVLSGLLTMAREDPKSSVRRSAQQALRQLLE